MLIKFNKLRLENKPESRVDFSGSTVVEARGFGYKGSSYRHIQYWRGGYKDCLDDIDIALVSYLQTRYVVNEEFLEGWEGIGEYMDNSLNRNIHEGPLGFIMPYLYDKDIGIGIIDEGWDEISNIDIYQVQDSGEKYKIVIPRIDQLFKTLSELVDFIKQEISKIRPSEVNKHYGIPIQPWEINEAREVLTKHGWDKQELRYLRWLGRCRGFGACIEVKQWCVDVVESKLDLTDDRIKSAWSFILKGLRTANKKCTELGFNGPNGLSGTYIYRATPEINLENFDEEDLVRMNNGRVYILREGD